MYADFLFSPTSCPAAESIRQDYLRKVCNFTHSLDDYVSDVGCAVEAVLHNHDALQRLAASRAVEDAAATVDASELAGRCGGGSGPKELSRPFVLMGHSAGTGSRSNPLKLLPFRWMPFRWMPLTHTFTFYACFAVPPILCLARWLVATPHRGVPELRGTGAR